MSKNYVFTYYESVKEAETLLHAGSILLGVPVQNLGSEFVLETDDYLGGLPEHLQEDVHKLLQSFNSRLLSLVLIRSFTPFIDLKRSKQEKYLKKWMNSRIPLLRSGFGTLRSLSGWGYYTQNNVVKQEMNFTGKPLGQEHKVPTLLYGKEPFNG